MTTVPTPWRPTLLLAASIVLHVAALLAIGVDLRHWEWAAAAAAARGEVAITIDDGPDLARQCSRHPNLSSAAEV